MSKTNSYGNCFILMFFSFFSYYKELWTFGTMKDSYRFMHFSIYLQKLYLFSKDEAYERFSRQAGF